MEDIFLGVPVVLGRGGIQRIIELDLQTDERALLDDSAKAVRGVMDVLDQMDI
jgi:malate dehydrogenase